MTMAVGAARAATDSPAPVIAMLAAPPATPATAASAAADGGFRSRAGLAR